MNIYIYIFFFFFSKWTSSPCNRSLPTHSLDAIHLSMCGFFLLDVWLSPQYKISTPRQYTYVVHANDIYIGQIGTSSRILYRTYFTSKSHPIFICQLVNLDPWCRQESFGWTFIDMVKRVADNNLIAHSCEERFFELWTNWWLTRMLVASFCLSVVTCMWGLFWRSNRDV